jgi:hypothetical protein
MQLLEPNELPTAPSRDVVVLDCKGTISFHNKKLSLQNINYLTIFFVKN